MKNVVIDTEKLTHLPELTVGAHEEPDDGMCVMEAVAWVTNEGFTDHPQCVSPVTAAFCRTWNDTEGEVGAAIRERLKGYIPRLVGTRSTPEVEERRAWLATDWLIRVYLPAWLHAAGLTAHATALAMLPSQTSAEALQASAVARDAAWAAARAAAGWAAARDAAGWAAAWDAAGAAARAAAGAAAWDAARDAAGWAAAWDAARDAAGAAARAAAGAAAWAAAKAAAAEKLAPTVEQLQESAWTLLDEMIACEQEAPHAE